MTARRCRITEGGGAHFGDDLWTCATCDRRKYPESFTCPDGRAVPRIFLDVPHGQAWQSPEPRAPMPPATQGLIGFVAFPFLLAAIILLISPFMNWIGGNGFVWIF